jgi:hypothetical protein
MEADALFGDYGWLARAPGALAAQRTFFWSQANRWTEYFSNFVPESHQHLPIHDTRTQLTYPCRSQPLPVVQGPVGANPAAARFSEC